MILVGLKKDIRDEAEELEKAGVKPSCFIATHDGEMVATQVGARNYLECSSLTGEGVISVFQAAAIASLLDLGEQSDRNCCLVM